MSAKSRGIARERDAKRWLEQQGWWVQRGPASLGVDLVCLRPISVDYGDPPICEARFIEVKANAGGPYMNFRRPERAALIAEAATAGATAFLLHWPSRKQPSLIPSENWPQTAP